MTFSRYLFSEEFPILNLKQFLILYSSMLLTMILLLKSFFMKNLDEILQFLKFNNKKLLVISFEDMLYSENNFFILFPQKMLCLTDFLTNSLSEMVLVAQTSAKKFTLKGGLIL